MGTTKSEHELELLGRFQEQFAEHELLALDELSVSRALLRIGRRGTSIFLTEIAISLGHIVLWGDIETCAFAGGDGGSWRSQLHWIGGGRDDLGYCASKVCRGTAHSLAYDTDNDVAMTEILELRRWQQLTSEQARDAWDSLRWHGESVEFVRDQLYCAGVDGETAGGLGEVVSPRVLCAIAALRTAYRLV